MKFTLANNVIKLIFGRRVSAMFVFIHLSVNKQTCQTSKHAGTNEFFPKFKIIMYLFVINLIDIA